MLDLSRCEAGSFFGRGGLFSRRDLEQIDLASLSLTPTGGQAVIEGWRCPDCPDLQERGLKGRE